MADGAMSNGMPTKGRPAGGTDIFLSYAREDRPTARAYAECLTEEGFSVWWDASLRSGETFDEVIEQRLRAAKAVVVLWSPRSVASRWVRAEATLADRRNKLAPAIIEACDRPIIFELTHAAELTDWTGDRADARWRTFVEDLQRLVEINGDAAAAEPVATAKPIRQPLRPGNDEVILAARRPEALRPVSEVLGPAAEFPMPVAPAEVHCLAIESAELPDRLIIIDGSGIKVGRSAPADVVLPHKSISREHCIIGLANDELLVSDLNSTNGTYIDEARISRATVLPVGSLLRIGQVALRHSVRSRAEADELTAAWSSPGDLPAERLAASS
jgi:hypothetical protein